MRALITARFPDHGILGEEHGHAVGRSEWEWVLDPIDGTRGFVSGFPTWGTIVGLRHRDVAVLGLVDQPWTQERWLGYPGHASFVDRLGQRPIRTRPCARLADAVLSTTSPEVFQTAAEKTVLAAFQAATRLRRYGGDCYAYALLAAGQIDLVVECGLYPYDVVGVIPIIEAAGGVVTTWDGGDAGQGGAIVAAGDARVHGEALRVLRGG